MSTHQRAEKPSTRFELLDAMRFFAALSVLFFHLGFRSWNMSVPGHIEFPFLSDVAKYGYLGVDLFFMISGFVILMSASKGSARSFLLSRIVRLYPAYWFCVVTTFSFFTYWHWGSDHQLPIKNLLVNLTMLQSFFDEPHVDGSYWTLAVELRFYGLILILLLSKKLIHIDQVLATWLLAGIAADFIPGLKEFEELYIASWCHYFVAGALAYRIHCAGINLFRLSFYGLAFAQASRHAQWYMTLKFHLTQIPYNPVVVQIVITLMFGLFFLIALGRLRLQHTSFRQLGALTYPLYLIHGAIGSSLIVFWVRQHGLNHWVALSVATTGSLFAAWIIQRQVEEPLASKLRAILTPWFAAKRPPTTN